MAGDMVRLRYWGTVSVGSPGRARLHQGEAALGDLIWDALGQAGWLGHTEKLRPLGRLVVSMAPCQTPGSTPMPRIESRLGPPRKPGEPGRRDDDGRIRQELHGPLHARGIGPGVRLVEDERRDEDFDFFENALYRCAATAGWLTVEPTGQIIGEIPDVEIIVEVMRYREGA